MSLKGYYERNPINIYLATVLLIRKYFFKYSISKNSSFSVIELTNSNITLS